MTQPTPDHDHFRATLLILQSKLLTVSSTGQEAAQQRRHIQLQRIESALQRLENDKYGWCLRCGEEISRKRLDVDPTVPLRITCAD